MSALKDDLLRTMTAEQESELSDKQKNVRQYLRRRAVIQYTFGGTLFVAALVALAYKAFVLH